MEVISRDVSSSDIWEMYQNDRYLESYNYKYDMNNTDKHNYIDDGGRDMYDTGNKVSTTNLYGMVIFYYISN